VLLRFFPPSGCVSVLPRQTVEHRKDVLGGPVNACNDAVKITVSHRKWSGLNGVANNLPGTSIDELNVQLIINLSVA
jgi:hypothetical protein